MKYLITMTEKGVSVSYSVPKGLNIIYLVYSTPIWVN